MLAASRALAASGRSSVMVAMAPSTVEVHGLPLGPSRSPQVGNDILGQQVQRVTLAPVERART